MVSYFPKMQKSSASFSQSIRNRLRLKKLQAQAKNFCRVLDIRVAEIVETDFFQSVVFQYNLEINTCVLLPFFQLRVTLFRMVSVIPDNAMFAGSKSTPSSWCKTP